ncbi:flavin oxidoreductase [Sphingobacterium sp. Ag1]|uniref:flavin reductase family protein n=1 Tax=Sphingobacterium sp. Ag1 TaxID=1643451 RepID=UPI0006275935|nr:flavin reductase [Sphingobacterium sp. Ag1]KKO91984.1 flavin oxidoreductase [Sphingobacterium sp. Ag1]
MIYNENAIAAFERRYRANFINSLGGFKSLVLIGTKNSDGSENLATLSSLFHLGADPALCGIILRPATMFSSTLDNILEQQYYTINHVSPVFVQQAHQCSAKYPKGVSEFEKVGLTPEYLEKIPVPFVRESKIKFACNFVQETAIELNGTTLVIGQITTAFVPNRYLKDDGYIDIEEAGTITSSGLDSYHTTSRIERLPYAKP